MSKMHSAKKLVIDFILVMLGNAIMALGTAGFAVPAKIILGGASGLALSFQHYVFYVHLSTLVLGINIIAFIAGYFLLGKKFAVGTLVSTFAFPFFLAIFEKSYYLTHLTKDTLLAAVYAGFLIGVGLGLVLRLGYSTGGMDIPPLLVNKYTGLSLGLLINIFDIIILIIQIPFIVLLLFNRYNIKSTKNIAILALIICASILAFVYYGESVYSNSYLSVRAESSIEEDTRLLIARECLDIGNQNFLFGVGPGCVSKFVSTGNFSHNTFLELYAGTGIIGLIIFTLMLINFLSVNYKRYKNTRNNEFAAMFIFGLIWTFDQIFYVFHNGLWLISFFILVSIHSELIHNKYQERKTIF